MRKLADFLGFAILMLMPDFSGVTAIEKADEPYATWVWNDGSKKTRRVTQIDASVTLAEIEEMFERMSAMSNAGLLKYKGAGVTREISINDVTILDESHGIETDLILSYQKQDTLATRELRIPAPGAEYFVGGVTLDNPIATIDGGTAVQNIINDMLVAVNAVINKTYTSGSLWGFTGGYLSTADASERRAVPNSARVFEPLAGSPADAPGEDLTP